ncbi:MAG: peptide chain release factor 1 [Candidatus Aenigmatarchaeota archaeon]|nr:MAG: peptide chain release factor 1 [Candidatus Aenigmarchaeota archaeon]
MIAMTDQASYKLKKLIKLLESKKGRHTELVTVYVPSGYSLHEVSNQLKQEQSTASNIKSKPVRKNVMTALEKIMRHLQLYRKTPEHGLAIFCGNVSEKEGWPDIELWAIEPPEKIKVKLYWCDQKFVLDPLKEMVREKEIYGIVCLDKSEADIALLKGKKLEPLVHFDSIVPGKTRAGGQSSARFSRVREGLLNDWLKHVGEAVNKTFQNKKDLIGIILSGPGPIKEDFMKGDYIQNQIKKKIIGVVDTGYTGEYGLQETIERSEDLLKEASVTKEKQIVQRFFEEMQKGGLVVYGLRETIKALKAGAVDTVLLSEDLDYIEVELECACGTTKKIIKPEEKGKLVCEKCNQQQNILGERDIIDYFEDEVKNYGSKLEIISSDTREGKQFFELGGIGAILRYKI